MGCYASPSELRVNHADDDITWADAPRLYRREVIDVTALGGAATLEGVDIPSAVTPAEASTLSRLAAGQLVLELGSLLGHSTVVLARSAEHVVAVDPHEGYPAANPRPTFGPFLENIERYGVRAKVTPMVGTDADVLPYLAQAFASERGRTFELVDRMAVFTGTWSA